MKSLLIGEAASDADLRAIQAAIVADGAVTSVPDLRTLHLAPERLL